MTDYNDVKPSPKKVEKAGEEVVVERVRKEAVVSGSVKKHKKGLVERLVVGILGPDGIPSIGSYVGKEIVKPAIKNIIADSITSGINMAMFGGDTPARRPPSGGYNNRSYSPKTNYNQSYAPKSNYVEGSVKTSRRSGGRVEEYIIDNRRDAQDVLNGLHESILEYGMVTVADYYDLVGVEPIFTDNSFGWTDLRATTITPVRGGRGYIINLPIPEAV